MGLFSRALLVFLRKESKKRRQKQPGKLMASFTAGQFARCLALYEPPEFIFPFKESHENFAGETLIEPDYLVQHPPTTILRQHLLRDS